MKGEIIKCLECGKERVSKTNGLTPKYCSMRCRNKFYYRKNGGAQAQREYLEKKRLKDNRPKIECKVCGKKFRQVGTHVVLAHGYESAREYREEYGFDLKRGQLPPDYRKLKADYVFENGTVENLKKGKKHWFKKGQKGVGVYKRSAQTLARLKRKSEII